MLDGPTLTYRSNRPYDFKLLERRIDFDGLIENAIHALSEHRDKHSLEGYIGCTLELLYPDLELVDPTKGGWANRVERLTEKIHRRFADVDWAITNLRGNMFHVLDFAEGFLPHVVRTAVRKNRYQLERSIEVKVPYRHSFTSTLIVLRTLLKMIMPDWFQYAARAQMISWADVLQENHIVRHTVLEEVARTIPWTYWLRDENYDDAVWYFSTPGIADIIAEECKGVYINADKSGIGERTVRRFLYKEGERLPLEINTPQDVLELVENHGFLAFYSSVESRDGDVRKVCIDLDARWLLQTILGPERTWTLQCALVDSILAFSASLGWASPGIKFSGSRGIHVYWDIEQGALGKEWIDLEPYRSLMYMIDPRIDQKKTTESYLKPFAGLKVLIQAFVLGAKNRFMDWSLANLTPQVLDALGFESEAELISVGGLEDRSDGKLSIDIISQKKGVFRSILSPHYKSGLVSRNIRNEFGQIGTPFRIWRFMKHMAMIPQVRHEVLKNPDSQRPITGILSRENLEDLAEATRAETYMIVKFGPAQASRLSPSKYKTYHNRYSKLTESLPHSRR